EGHRRANFSRARHLATTRLGQISRRWHLRIQLRAAPSRHLLHLLPMSLARHALHADASLDLASDEEQHIAHTCFDEAISILDCKVQYDEDQILYGQQRAAV